MSNLTPEVRVNKNGMPVTKHVRVDMHNPAGLPKLPAPTVQGSKPTAKKLPARLTKQKKWEYLKGLLMADRALVRTAPQANHAHMYYRFEVSDLEAYDVMKVVDARNVIPLLDAGIRTKKDAVEFLESKGLRHLIIDNLAFSVKTMNYGITAQGAIQMRNDLPDIEFTHPRYMDAMEANSFKALREVEPHLGMTYRVLNGEISIEDIRVLGAGRAASGGGGANSQVIQELKMMKEGTSTMSAEQLKQVIDKADPLRNRTDTYKVNEVVRAARVYGVESLLALRWVNGVTHVADRFTALEEDPLEVGKMMVWQDQYRRATRSLMGEVDVYPLYKAGISVEDAAEYWQDGMKPQQVLALKDEGISPSISSGWL